MKRDYWAIYHPEHGYYLGKRGDTRYKRYAFGYNSNPVLYKDPNAATIAYKALPDKAKQGAMVVVCSVVLPYDKPSEGDDLLKEAE